MSDENKKLSKNRIRKEQIVAKLNDKLIKSKAIVFTNYQGLTHKQLERLKKAIKPVNAEFVIAKNSLVLRALNINKLKIEDEKQFEGPTGTLLMYQDSFEPLKQLAKLIKELGIPSIKFGIMEGKHVTGEQILKLSTLPSREVLLTQVVDGLKSPIYGLHKALSWNLQKLVLTLSVVANSRPTVITDPTSIARPQEPEPKTEVTQIQEAQTEEKQKEHQQNHEAQANKGGEN